MAGDDRFLASGHYGSDTISERLNEGWSPGGEYVESYFDGTMNAESSMTFEALMEENSNSTQHSMDAYQAAESIKLFDEYFATLKQGHWWSCRTLLKEATYRPIGPSGTSELDSVIFLGANTDSLSRFGLSETHVSRPYSEMGDSVDLVINHTFSEDLKNVVSVIEDSDSFDPEVASIVEDMRKICQDDEALSAMCIYISVVSKWDHVPPKMKEAIARQPWGKRGEDAMKTYQKFLANAPTLLSPVVAVALTEKLITEYESHVKKSGLEIMGPKTNLFDKMPNSPHRRPSVRSGNRSNESQPREGQLKRARPQQTSPKRAHTPPAKPAIRSPFGKRPRSAESNQESGDLDENEKTTIQQNLMAGDLPTEIPSWAKKDYMRVFTELGGRDALKNALIEKGKVPIKPEDKHRKPRRKGAKDPSFHGIIPSSTVFENIKNHLVELFLPGKDLKTCGILEQQLNNTVELYKMLQKPWAPSHIRQDPNVRCESETEDDTGTSCLGGGAKDWPKCFLEMLTENAIFLGKSSPGRKMKKSHLVVWEDFFKAFEQPENFYLCFTRAITKQLDKYFIDTKPIKYRGPVFYPNHVEMALIKQARRQGGKINRIRNNEAQKWATVLGIDFNQVKHRLAVYRAKEVKHVDYTLDTAEIEAKKGGPHRTRMKGSVAGAMRGGLATSHVSDDKLNQAIEFLGETGYFEIPEEIQAMMRRWLIHNAKNLTDENRFDVDAQTIEDWRKLLKTKYPRYTSSLTDGVIHRYMHLFQERNRSKFPNLTLCDMAFMEREFQEKMQGSP